MVGIQGIGGPQEPRPDRPSSVRDNRPSPSTDQDTASDGVVLSNAAAAAAALTKALEVRPEQEVRADRVEAAKQAIQRGDFRKPEIVQAVADRISRLL